MHTLMLSLSLAALLALGSVIFIYTYKFLNKLLKGPVDWVIRPTSARLPELPLEDAEADAMPAFAKSTGPRMVGQEAIRD